MNSSCFQREDFRGLRAVSDPTKFIIYYLLILRGFRVSATRGVAHHHASDDRSNVDEFSLRDRSGRVCFGRIVNRSRLRAIKHDPGMNYAGFAGTSPARAVTNPFLKAEFDKCHGKFRRHAAGNPINHRPPLKIVISPLCLLGAA